MDRAYGRIARAGLGFVLGLTLLVGQAAAAPPTPKAAKPAQGALTAFKSQAELVRFLKRPLPPRGVGAVQLAPPPPPVLALHESPAVSAAAAPAEKVSVKLEPISASNVTNTQEANVDEGDIVKARGDLLVILRRGRLFTVSIAGGGLKPVDAINAFPPGVDASDDWYDEMLLSGDRVVVIGYSYARGGTQIDRFKLDAAGHLTFEDAYQLRSNDYYSDRNYASRLIGSKLIVYSPLYLNRFDPLASMPALRRWSGQKGEEGFKRIIEARQVFVTPRLRRDRDAIEAIHSVTSCDLDARVLNCSAVAVLGPESRNFYVSGKAVYLWVNGARPRAGATVYRLPFDASPPRAIRARGAPTDQFSFREEAGDGALSVLVRSEGRGDAMWRPEFSSGAVALLRIPLDEFGDGSGAASPGDYRMLPRPKSDDDSFQNRFVGAYVLYGTGAGWLATGGKGSELVAAPVQGGPVVTVRLPHGADRIEPMGRDAVVIGGAGPDLVFSTIDLRTLPVTGDRYVLPQASQAETRSHGFYYKPDAEPADGDSGILGLPVARPTRPAYRQLFETSAALVLVRRTERKFSPMGELAAHDEGAVDDHCQASCVDWYGNARPIFWQGRIFALLGYELVEGSADDRGIHEVGRTNFAGSPGR